MDTITHPTDDFQTAFDAKFLYNSRQPVFYSPKRTIMSDYTRTDRAANSLRNIKITPNSCHTPTAPALLSVATPK